MFDKNIYLDKVSKNFVENLKIDKPLYEMNPQDAREFLHNLQKNYLSDINASVENIEIFDTNTGSISVTLVRPQDVSENELPIILYCHGGGWVIGDFSDYEMTVKTIANMTKSAVAFVNYPHAPEFSYPHAINHVYGALKFLYENADKYNLDRTRIALVGDSAGGNLAIHTTLKIQKEKMKISCLALIYPVCDNELKTNSYEEYKNGPWLSKKAMEWFWKCYMPDNEDRKKYISPLNTDIELLKHFPPSLIITAENDVLRDEGETFARNLISAGVEMQCIRINNLFHDFIMLNALRDSTSVRCAYSILNNFIKDKLNVA